MKSLSKVSELVTPSPIREMFNKAAGMQDVISFTVGEPDFRTAPHIVEAAVDALRRGEHHYTPNAGILPLRQAIADSVRASHGLDYDPEAQVIVTAGGMEALMLTMMTLLDPGDEWILSDPGWTNYPRQIRICSAEPRFAAVEPENDFLYTPESLEAAVTEKTKGFVLNSPGNPTGSVAGAETLRKLAEIAVKHDLYVISDEVYARLLYDGAKAGSIAALPGMQERTVIVNSFSKTYAMTGWRVGYALGPAEIIRKMVILQENVAACVNSAAQYGALAALTGPQEPVEAMLAAYTERRRVVLEEFRTVKGLKCFAPQGAFYAFVDISQTGMDAADFAEALLEKARVIVVPGHAFGERGRRYVRLSFAVSADTIREGIARIRRFMETLGA